MTRYNARQNSATQPLNNHTRTQQIYKHLQCAAYMQHDSFECVTRLGHSPPWQPRGSTALGEPPGKISQKVSSLVNSSNKSSRCMQ